MREKLNWLRPRCAQTMAGLLGAHAARVILTFRMILTYIEGQALCLGQELKGSGSTPGEIWQCLETSVLQLVGGKVLLVFGEERPRMLLNIPAVPRTAPQPRILHSKMSIVLRLINSALESNIFKFTSQLCSFTAV